MPGRSVGFDGKSCVLELSGGKVFRGEPVLERTHFPSGPGHRGIRSELEQQYVALLHLICRLLDDLTLAQHLMLSCGMAMRQGGYGFRGHEGRTVGICQRALRTVS